MDARGEFHVRVGQVARVAEDVDRLPADRRQEHLQVASRDQFRVHAPGLLEQGAAQVGLGAAEAAGHFGQKPDRLDRGFGHHRGAAGGQEFAVGLEPAGLQRLDHLRQDHVRLRDRDGRADVVAGREFGGKRFRDQCAPRVQRDDATRLAPLRIGPDRVRRRGVGQVGPVLALQRTGGPRRGRGRRCRSRCACRSRCGARAWWWCRSPGHARPPWPRPIAAAARRSRPRAKSVGCDAAPQRPACRAPARWSALPPRPPAWAGRRGWQQARRMLKNLKKVRKPWNRRWWTDGNRWTLWKLPSVQTEQCSEAHHGWQARG